MARPAETFEVRWIIGTPMRLGYDVIDRCCWGDALGALTVHTEVFVATKYEWPQLIPARPVASLMPRLPSLVLLPSLITMLLTVTRTVSGCSSAATLAACPCYL